jgi:hypothetical protein
MAAAKAGAVDAPAADMAAGSKADQAAAGTKEAADPAVMGVLVAEAAVRAAAMTIWTMISRSRGRYSGGAYLPILSLSAGEAVNKIAFA